MCAADISIGSYELAIGRTRIIQQTVPSPGHGRADLFPQFATGHPVICGTPPYRPLSHIGLQAIASAFMPYLPHISGPARGLNMAHSETWPLWVVRAIRVKVFEGFTTT